MGAILYFKKYSLFSNYTKQWYFKYQSVPALYYFCFTVLKRPNFKQKWSSKFNRKNKTENGKRFQHTKKKQGSLMGQPGAIGQQAARSPPPFFLFFSLFFPLTDRWTPPIITFLNRPSPLPTSPAIGHDIHFPR
jgi:hypothetical protein